MPENIRCKHIWYNDTRNTKGELKHMEKRLEELYLAVNNVIDDMPEEDECTDEENEVFAECMNLKEALERLKDRKECKGLLRMGCLRTVGGC